MEQKDPKDQISRDAGESDNFKAIYHAHENYYNILHAKQTHIQTKKHTDIRVKYCSTMILLLIALNCVIN